MSNSAATDILGDFVSLFFPRYCAGCEDALVKGEEYICTRCIADIPRTNFHLHPDNSFYQKIRGRMPVNHVMAFMAFTKAGKVQNILHTLKYRNQPELGRMLGRIYGTDLKAAGFENKFDVLIPIPLHKNKHLKRGYNQSEEFGAGLADGLGSICEGDCMQRLYQTDTQTRKSRLARWMNVKEVFALSNGKSVEGKRVLLIDDVVTTGATLEAAGRVLLDAGCLELSIASLAATT